MSFPVPAFWSESRSFAPFVPSSILKPGKMYYLLLALNSSTFLPVFIPSLTAPFLPQQTQTMTLLRPFMAMDPPQIIFSSASTHIFSPGHCQWWQPSFLMNQIFLEVPLCFLADCPLCFRGVSHKVYAAIASYSFSSCLETHLCCDADKAPDSRFCVVTCPCYASDNNFPVIWCTFIVLRSLIVPCHVHRASLKTHLTQCKGSHCFQRLWIRLLDAKSLPFYRHSQEHSGGPVQVNCTSDNILPFLQPASP